VGFAGCTDDVAGVIFREPIRSITARRFERGAAYSWGSEVRLGAPLICFLLVVALRWFAEVDLWGIMSSLPPELHPLTQSGTEIAVWLATAWLASSLFQRLVLRITRRRGVTNKLPKLLSEVGSILIFFVAGLWIVTHVFGQPIFGVLATSGVFAAFIGFSVQKTIADIAAGITLSLEQSIKLGDWIETSTGVIGRVIDMTWRTTRLETIEGRMVVVPNSVVSGGQFTNFNAPQRYLRFTKTISIDYGVPTDRVLQILEAAVRATPGVLAQPESTVRIDSLGSTGVVYAIYHWVADFPDSFRVSSDLLANALNFLDQAGITPIYPRTDVTLLAETERHINRRIDLAAILRRTPFFAAVDQNSLQTIEQGSRLVEFAAGSMIVQEADAGTSLFLVIAGLLNVSKRIPGGLPRVVGTLAPGSVFGEMSLLTGAPRSATVAAATQVMLIEIRKEQIGPVIMAHPEIIGTFGKLIAEREAANESVLSAWPEERQEIARLGVAAFLRAKIAYFFGVAPS
jgi:small-conductance mechanosensitive channel